MTYHKPSDSVHGSSNCSNVQRPVSEALSRRSAMPYNPLRWRRLWALYTHMNEHCRAEYERGVHGGRRPLMPWNEQTLLGMYQGSFPAGRKAA